MSYCSSDHSQVASFSRQLTDWGLATFQEPQADESIPFNFKASQKPIKSQSKAYQKRQKPKQRQKPTLKSQSKNTNKKKTTKAKKKGHFRPVTGAVWRKIPIINPLP